MEAIERGATYELACRYAGITSETFRLWLQTKPALAAAVHQAEGEAALRWLGQIDAAAAAGAWQAAAWKRERRYPQA